MGGVKVFRAFYVSLQNKPKHHIIMNTTKKLMTTLLLVMLACMSAIVLAGCGHDTVFDEPEAKVYTAENDPALEKLKTNVGRYNGEKGVDLTRIEFAYRAAGQYCIFPFTKSRAQRLEQLAQQEGSQVQNCGDFFLVTRGRDFITGDDYVSDMYFAGYYRGEPEFVIISPRITVCAYNTKAKDRILDAYFGKLIEASNTNQGEKTVQGCYLFKFVCNLKTSEQVLNLADKLFKRDDVRWAEASMYAPIHFDI